jgi:hypothetical protein
VWGYSAGEGELPEARDKRLETKGVFQMWSEHMPAVVGDNYEIGAELLTRGR